MPPKITPKFTEGERVLCFHGPLLYEAKATKHEIKDKSVRYFIHYNGWNKNWDEWVPESRVLKYNETALQKQKELAKAHAKTKSAGAKVKNKKGDSEKDKDKDKDKDKLDKDKEKDKDKSGRDRDKSSSASSDKSQKQKNRDNSSTSSKDQDSSSTSEPPKKKRARVDPTVESIPWLVHIAPRRKEETFLTKIEVKIKIPEDLKPWLVDDWDLVTRQKQLVTLPAKMSVDNILDEYCKTKLAKPNNPNKDAILEVTQGIREYFNSMLGTQLLWKFERPQYAEVLADHPDTPMSQIYGAIHLLRLFVKLGGMLAYTPLDEKSISLLLTHIQDFLKYLQKNACNLFSVSDYHVAPPEYHRKAV